MISKNLFFSIISAGILVLTSPPVNAQIVRGLDSEIHIERWKSIFRLYSKISGHLYSENKYLAEFYANDTLYLFNLQPGKHNFKFVIDNDSVSLINSHIRRGKVTAYQIDSNSVLTSIKAPRYEEIAREIHGKTVFFVPAMVWFAEIEVHHKEDRGGVSIIGGYRFRPEIAIGGGIGFERFPNSNFYTPTNFTASFYPVFLRINLGLGSRRLTPFFRLDYGCVFTSAPGSYSSDFYSFDIVKGGRYSAYGLGLRIGITKNFYSTVFFESKVMDYVADETWLRFQQPPEQKITDKKQRLSFLNFSLGYHFL